MREVMTNSEAANFLGVSVSFLNKARLAGTGPLFSKIGSRVVYRREALLQWLHEREYAATCEYR